MANRLSTEISSYLIQHSANPVDWRPWGAEAFAEARRREVPVLLSVGYAACHWCHVMAHESFEDPEVATLVNDNFVAVKVDRVERPDVDSVFMLATQALTGQGGWPMTVFLTPEGAPFFAGTYYPPERRGQMPSFTEVVTTIADAWATRREEVLASAVQIVDAIDGIDAVQAVPEDATLRDAVASVLADFDAIHGGFGGAPKFPNPMVLDALLVKGEPASLDVAQRTLEAMGRGGIHDQLGGGFARYCVDAGWVVPHFEKMLYDNALLLATYTRGWCRTADHDGPLRDYLAGIVRGIVGWLEREMRTETGVFAAALDADSSDARGRPHEGIYYVWNHELLADALGADDAEWAAQVFHVTAQGSFDHGLSTLQLRGNPDPARLADVTRRLLAARSERFRPARDDMVVAAWNGWTIEALARAAMVFGEPGWLDLARTAADGLWRTHWIDGRLRRTSRDGVAGTPAAVLDDYAAVAQSFVTLAGIEGDATWLERAGLLLDVVLDHFGAPDGGFFDTADDAEPLFKRPRELTDNATPAGSSAAVTALHSYSLATGDARYAERATEAAAAQRGLVLSNPRFAGSAFADALIADEARARLLRAVTVVSADSPFDDLARAAYRMIPAGTFVLVAPPVRAAAFGGVAGLATAESDAPAAYVVRGEKVLGPASGVDELRQALWTRV